MGTLKEGVFGGFSGRVGKVVGASWRDIYYIRSLPSKVNDPKTEKQIKQRSRFSVVMEFLKTITPFIRIGFQSHASGRMTAFNAAMSYNMRHGVKKGEGGMVLDFPNVLVSRGSLVGATGIQTTIVNGELRVEWDADLSENARYDDVVLLLAYNPVKKQSVYDLNAGKRGATEARLQLPSVWTGNILETYVTFRTSEGLDVSNSVYAGANMYRN